MAIRSASCGAATKTRTTNTRIVAFTVAIACDRNGCVSLLFLVAVAYSWIQLKPQTILISNNLHYIRLSAILHMFFYLIATFNFSFLHESYENVKTIASPANRWPVYWTECVPFFVAADRRLQRNNKAPEVIEINWFVCCVVILHSEHLFTFSRSNSSDLVNSLFLSFRKAN